MQTYVAESSDVDFDLTDLQPMRSAIAAAVTCNLLRHRSAVIRERR